MANIVDQSVTLQSNTHLGKIFPVAWVAGMMHRKRRVSDTSKLPKELKELLNRSSDNVSRGEVEVFRLFLHEFKDALQFGASSWEEPLLYNIASI